MLGGTRQRCPGKLSSTVDSSVIMSSSEAVAVCTCSHVRGWLDVSAETRDSWIVASIESDALVSSVAIPAMRFVGIMGEGCVVRLVIEWASSGRIILSGVGVPDGYLERASGVLFLTPGMWIILNLYLI